MNFIYNCKCGGKAKIETVKVDGAIKHQISCTRCEHSSPPLSTILGAMYKWEKQNEKS